MYKKRNMVPSESSEIHMKLHIMYTIQTAIDDHGLPQEKEDFYTTLQQLKERLNPPLLIEEQVLHTQVLIYN